MKKILIYLLFAAVGYKAYSDYTGKDPLSLKNSSTATGQDFSFEDQFESSEPVPAQNFSCDGRQHCSQMRSYEEALYFLRNCPDTKMDGDHDGIPCERQFGR